MEGQVRRSVILREPKGQQTAFRMTGGTEVYGEFDTSSAPVCALGHLPLKGKARGRDRETTASTPWLPPGGKLSPKVTDAGTEGSRFTGLSF